MSRKNESCVFKKYCNRQSQYNSQLNRGRMKRVIIFNKFLECYPDLYKWPLKKLLDFCGTKKGVEFILSYTSGKKMNYFKSCPSCGEKDFTLLSNHEGNHATGFLTRYSTFYYL